MATESLEFSENWNGGKLDNKAFTTLRLSARFQIGQEVDIYLKKQKKGTAIVIDKKELRLHQINEYIAYLDTGYNAKECQALIKKMYGKDVSNWESQPLYFYLLAYTKVNLKDIK